MSGITRLMHLHSFGVFFSSFFPDLPQNLEWQRLNKLQQGMEKERNDEQAIQLLRLQTFERKRKDGTLITNDRVFWFICVFTIESEVLRLFLQCNSQPFQKMSKFCDSWIFFFCFRQYLRGKQIKITLS